MRTLEGLALRRLVQEVKATASGGKIQRVTFPSDWEISIDLATSWGPRGLLVSAHPELSVFALCPSFEKGEPPKTAWQKLLHKYLVGGKILSFAQVGWDRVVEVLIYNPTLWEKETEFVLFLELTGRNVNLILARNDPERTILGALRQVTPEENRWRSILPGIPYTPPPRQNKLDPLEFARNPSLPRVNDIAHWCLRNLDGFGPFLSSAVAELSERLEGGFQEALRQVLKPLEEETGTFLVFLSEEGHPWVSSGKIPLSSLPPTCTPSPLSTRPPPFCFSPSGSIFSRRQQEDSKKKNLREDLEFITREIQKIDALLPREEDIELLRLKGELLKILPHLEVLERTSEGIRVRNPLTSSPVEVFIALSPALSPGENMQEYFKKYRKMRERLARLQKKRQELEARKERILALLENPQALESTAQPKEDRKVATGIIRFRTPSGNEIWVGKNAWANRLLVRMASRNDYWFHVRDLPGAHVILKAFHPETLHEDILRAAQVAAHFSAGKFEGKVEVACTQVKYLRAFQKKPGGKSSMSEKKPSLSPFLSPGAHKSLSNWK